MIRDLLINAIHIETPHCALLLSGGVDSISAGLAAHYAGKKVHAYSFRLDMHNSYDIQKAEEVAKYMDWEFTPIVVPTDNLEQDWITLANLGCKKKTHFECVFPFLYVYPHIIEKYVVTLSFLNVWLYYYVHLSVYPFISEVYQGDSLHLSVYCSFFSK